MKKSMCERCVYRADCEGFNCMTSENCEFFVEEPKEFYDWIKPTKIEIKPTVSDYVRDFCIGYCIGLGIGLLVKATSKLIKRKRG